jgi:hypothetical protein
VTDVARYLVGNGDEVVCEMEHFPKHGIASFGSLGIAATFRIGDGCTLISSLAVSFRFASGTVGRERLHVPAPDLPFGARKITPDRAIWRAVGG